MREPGTKNQLLKAPVCSKGFSEERVELVISPPFNSTQLLRCMGQLDSILRDGNSYSSIMSSINSFSKGILIVLQMQADKLSDLIIRLTNLPEVERIEEDLPATGISSTPSARPSRKLRVILKEPQIVVRELVAVAA